MSDIALIEQINNQLLRPLKQVKTITWITKGYVLNDRQQVTHLSVFRSRLKGKIPAELFQLNHLIYLDIRENEIEELPSEINKLERLELLDLRLNQLQSLPESITGLKQLTKLYLGQNQYKAIPPAVATIEQLSLIDLTDNEISAGFEHLLRAAHLKNIYLNNNRVTTFPFDQLSDVKWDELVLIENPLKQKPGVLSNHIKRLIL